ncbi:hypothetical protein QYE76_058916 [Lolium multiflorum]|uniref:KIB1-4 beta-propeller domain-containing protein n=1 Tax=Lolium multiflorum TaxID=4521 RepID=A0AAD8T6F3_LOLMU|nr:hypothetical protein QYE76_058916 [Lolium multiflorum]
MRPDWSSLPSELLGHIADYLLATNDVDCYKDFRAVCTSWRSATEDPKSNLSDLRFRPRRWIIVDEVFQTDARLMINTVTGRVRRKDLPLLRKYDVITTTPCGFLVLADLEPPHAARVLNPLTGHMIRFMAAVPFELGISAAALFCESSPELLLLPDRCQEQYSASLDRTGNFTLDECMISFLATRLAVGGGFSTDDRAMFVPYPFCFAGKMCHQLEQFAIDGSRLFSYHASTGFADLPGTGHTNHCFYVWCAGQPLVVIMQQDRFQVFCMETGGDEDELEPVNNIRDQAIFVGYRRSLSVSAGSVPSVDANCIYYVKSTDSALDIYKYDLETQKQERVSEAIDSLNPNTLSLASLPFTLLQLLSSYTINAWESQLAIQRQQKRDAESEYIKSMLKTLRSMNEESGSSTST